MDLNENKEILEYKNLWIFYKNLYSRLFKLINLIIEERSYNIRLVKEELIDFTDNYSYYIIGKKILNEKEIKDHKESDDIILKRLKEFDKFTESIDKFPSSEFIKIRRELLTYDGDVAKLGLEKYIKLVQEYYYFFNEVLKILAQFITIASLNGFLPNIKSQTALKTIGYANYDFFFAELENLKLQMSEITTHISLSNIMKCRRCIYSVLVIFSPYFKRQRITEELALTLDFEFLQDKTVLETMRNSSSYDSFEMMPSYMQERVNGILIPLKKNISIIKRYMSYEFGEVDMSPKIKKKYGFDPTWT